MHGILLIDFGSTYTKLTAVDLDAPRVLGHAQAFTTAKSDISIGLDEALKKLQAFVGVVEFQTRLACSSAAGGSPACGGCSLAGSRSNLSGSSASSA